MNFQKKIENFDLRIFSETLSKKTSLDFSEYSQKRMILRKYDKYSRWALFSGIQVESPHAKGFCIWLIV